MHRCLLLFEESLKSEHTKKQYRKHLDQFLEFTKLKDYESILQLEPKMIQELLEDYLFYLKKTVKNSNNVQPKFPGVKHFLEMNDVLINWKKIYKMFPEKTKTPEYRTWTTKEIQSMLNATTSLRNKAIIHFMASTGSRIGVFEHQLRLKHLKNMEGGCKAVLLYAGTKEEYWSFLTPEASKMLDEYLERRRRDSEHLDEESPVFRENYTIGIAKAQSLSYSGVRSIVYRLVKRGKIERKKVGDRTYDVQIDHGFRKRFNTILKLKNEINSNIAEKILGHRNGLDGVYFVPSLDERFNEFKKAIPDLTIDEAIKLREQLKAKEELLKKQDEKDTRVEDLTKRLSDVERILKSNMK